MKYLSWSSACWLWVPSSKMKFHAFILLLFTSRLLTFQTFTAEKDKGSRPTHVLPDLSVTEESGCPSLLDGARGLFLRGKGRWGVVFPRGSNTVTAGWLSQKWERNDNLAASRRGHDPLRGGSNLRFWHVMRLFVALKAIWASSMVWRKHTHTHTHKGHRVASRQKLIAEAHKRLNVFRYCCFF